VVANAGLFEIFIFIVGNIKDFAPAILLSVIITDLILLYLTKSNLKLYYHMAQLLCKLILFVIVVINYENIIALAFRARFPESHLLLLYQKILNSIFGSVVNCLVLFIAIYMINKFYPAKRAVISIVEVFLMTTLYFILSYMSHYVIHGYPLS